MVDDHPKGQRHHCSTAGFFQDDDDDDSSCGGWNGWQARLDQTGCLSVEQQQQRQRQRKGSIISWFQYTLVAE